MQFKPTTLPAFDSTYGTYLASREWALKKVAVRERSGGRCEHCELRSATETHHKTYDRIYHEDLDDLMAVCHLCHEYLSGLRHVDPRHVCCTVEEARAWVECLADDDDPELVRASLRHLAEVEDVWLE